MPDPLGEDPYPSAAELKEMAALGDRFFPIPPLEPPKRPQSDSSRLRQRWGQKRSVWHLALNYITSINLLHGGVCTGPTPRRSMTGASPRMRAAWTRVHCCALREASRLCRARRGCDLTGAESMALLTRRDTVLPYGCRRRTVVPQVPLSALAVDEPKDDFIVDMLDALDDAEARYYAEERNVISFEGKSQLQMAELEEHYGFVGGEEREYLAYLWRDDLPKGMWGFIPRSEARAISGFSVVPKKDPSKQRKLLMSCATNYAFRDVRRRRNHGLHGGGALSGVRAPLDDWEVSAFDENNAFTRVATPAWMWPWMCTPPVRAAQVWGLLTHQQRANLGPEELVCPSYHRMAMGLSDAVHILMAINVRHVALTLWDGARLDAVEIEMPELELLGVTSWCNTDFKENVILSEDDECETGYELMMSGPRNVSDKEVALQLH